VSSPSFEIENIFWKQGKVVIGIDEAGRGCLAGPVVAAAVAFPAYFSLSNKLNIVKINDSKKLSKLERENAFEFIKENAIYFNYALIDNSIIDLYNILQATQIAMNISLNSNKFDNSIAIVDGNYFLNLHNLESYTIVQGDSKSFTIAAASIVAKVIRDRFVVNYINSLYPEYGFAEHKGYATRKHFEAIQKFGKTTFHRNSFLVKYRLRQEMNKYQLKLF